MEGHIEEVPNPTSVPQEDPVKAQEALPLPDASSTSVDPASAELEQNIGGIDLANLPTAENGVQFGFAEMPAAHPVLTPAQTSDAMAAKQSASPAAGSSAATPAQLVSPVDNGTPNPFRDVHRQESTPWIDSTTRTLPLGMATPIK
jgi:hypothetical protein